ncbi:pyridoxal-phosphate dependent enzyme [Vulcanisaeta distributa]|uniref:pyridoxal-phosphate dependent enzyme n=1 Tax=Vulcanisaeta distributa TaxID=164451 RepID=UPI000B23C7CA|nr:pyridoxal-phosphate dependent enzyme [Vulcanisaeta distributa]
MNVGGLWRFTSVIPAKPLVSLGEGFTPLINADFLGNNVYLKLEYLNPTGSFKDRALPSQYRRRSSSALRPLLRIQVVMQEYP